MRPGERGLAVAFAAMGVLWAVKARDLPYTDEFAPGAGFLPFWLGVVIVGLAALLIATARRTPPAPPSPGRPRKVAAVVLGLFACIVAIEPLGLGLPVAAYLLYLVRAVERRGWGLAAGVALGTTAAILLVFRAWLSVPLPRGPWGF